MRREQWPRTPVSFPLPWFPHAQGGGKKEGEKKVENREEQVREGFRLITTGPAVKGVKAGQYTVMRGGKGAGSVPGAAAGEDNWR